MAKYTIHSFAGVTLVQWRRALVAVWVEHFIGPDVQKPVWPQKGDMLRQQRASVDESAMLALARVIGQDNRC